MRHRPDAQPPIGGAPRLRRRSAAAPSGPVLPGAGAAGAQEPTAYTYGRELREVSTFIGSCIRTAAKDILRSNYTQHWLHSTARVVLSDDSWPPCCGVQGDQDCAVRPQQQ